MDYIYQNLENLKQLIETYVDLDYSIWLYRLLMPLIITFLLPFVFVALIYLTFLILLIYKWHRQVILRAVTTDRNFWDFGRLIVAALWDAHARIYHGYEVVGLENLPTEGPALIVYYHGAMPIDMYYFCARVLLQRGRLIYTVGDRFLFKLPGWGLIADVFNVSPGTIQSCSNTLKDGNLLAISPGGVYEAQFGDHYYELLWRNRCGFAKVALDAKVKIIPFFTANLREGFRQVNFMRNFFMKLYNATRIPVRPIYGGFPVKFISYVGEPMEYDPNITPEQLQEKIALKLEDLINKHQRIPGSILKGLLDRFSFTANKNRIKNNKYNNQLHLTLVPPKSTS